VLAHLTERAKDVHIEHAASIAAIEAFAESVLHWATRFDEVQRDLFTLGPFGQRQRDELRAVVQGQFPASLAMR